MFLFQCGELGDIIYLDEMCSADRVNIKLVSSQIFLLQLAHHPDNDWAKYGPGPKMTSSK